MAWGTLSGVPRAVTNTSGALLLLLADDGMPPAGSEVAYLATITHTIQPVAIIAI